MKSPTITGWAGFSASGKFNAGKTDMSDLGHSATDSSWLRHFPELTSIRDEAGLAALHSATVHAFPAGAPIMRCGELCRGFVLLARGSVRVYEADANGREIVLYRVRAGELCVLTLSIHGILYGRGQGNTISGIARQPTGSLDGTMRIS